MESLGQKLRAARERKRMSLSQAAAKTRIMIQHLDAMEKDDFSRMPAPAYAKGFIRMYAEFLGLEAAPLVQEYVERHLRKEPSALQGAPADAEPSVDLAKARGAIVALTKRVLASPWLKRTPVRVGLGAAVLLLIIGLARCGRPAPADNGDAKPPPRENRQPALAVIREPPEPYIPLPDSGAQKP